MSPSPLRHPARLAGASLLRLQSDDRLAELAASGHEAAFAAIVDRYRTPLTRYCSGIVGPSRAEDAVQQALINAHDALRRTDEVRHLRSWMYRIAHNASLNVLRAVRDDVSLDEAGAALPEAGGAGPAEAIERSERFQATVAALRELPERQRAALVLRELEGRSHEEIAAALGVSPGAARQHLMRARTAMRAAVTAVTPYPLIVRLAEALAGGGGAGWTDAAVGVGTGATLAKLTAGVVATGALVGGAVRTQQVVHHHRQVAPAAAAERTGRGVAKDPVVRGTAVALPAAASAGATAAPKADDHGARAGGRGRREREGAERHRDHRRSHHHGATGSDGGSGSLDSGADRSGPGAGGSGSSGRHGGDDTAADDDDHRGSGRPDDAITSGRDSSGKGSGGKDTDTSGESTTSGRGRDSDSGDASHGGRQGSGSGDVATVTAPTATTPAPAPTTTAPEPVTTTTPTPGSGDAGSGGSGSGSGGSSGGSGKDRSRGSDGG